MNPGTRKALNQVYTLNTEFLYPPPPITPPSARAWRMFGGRLGDLNENFREPHNESFAA